MSLSYIGEGVRQVASAIDRMAKLSAQTAAAIADSENDHRLTAKEEVWLRAWVAVASDGLCVDLDIATKWANEAVDQFEQKFPERRSEP